ncbi:GAF domain-containing protein [Aquihabitans sp. G128]|uniref:GAF domain-containing protein n=1 Tax=Aquihabitans sp. G128 TaxID=2849779 RepID=UPI001C225481|nr:GAF domain-containing protein [Aquihabitans sp. G128]QXC60367.1 GAF domain-containing protein [Aquihabitans sp. G128]
MEARFVPASSHEVLCIVRDITDRHRAEQALAEQVAFEALVTAISTRLISCAPGALDAAIVAGLGEIAGFFAADTAFIDELSADGGTLHLSHLWTRPGHEGGRWRGQRVDLAGFGWLTARFERTGHVFARGPRHLPPEATETSLVGADDLGVLWVRLGAGGDLAGVVGLTWTSHEPPATDEVLGLVRFAADAFHGAIRRRSVALLAEGQAEVFEAIARSEPVATALLGAGQLLARHTLGATVLVITVGEDRLDLVAEDVDDPWVSWFAERPLDLANPYGQAVVTGEPVVVADALSDPRFGGDAVPEPSFRSVSVLPVRSPRDGRTLALIALLGAEPAATTRAPACATRPSPW